MHGCRARWEEWHVERHVHIRRQRTGPRTAVGHAQFVRHCDVCSLHDMAAATTNMRAAVYLVPSRVYVNRGTAVCCVLRVSLCACGSWLLSWPIAPRSVDRCALMLP